MKKFAHTPETDTGSKMHGIEKSPEFPVWDTPDSPSPQISMNDYLAFVDFCWKCIPDKDRLRRERDKLIPTVQFEL